MSTGVGEIGPESVGQQFSEQSPRLPSEHHPAGNRGHGCDLEMEQPAQEQERRERGAGIAQPDRKVALSEATGAEQSQKQRKQICGASDQRKEQ